MDKIALDVVLLPSDQIMDAAIGINRKLIKSFGRHIVLNKKKCVPHISLVMGTMDKKYINEVRDCLKNLSKSTPPLKLKASALYSKKKLLWKDSYRA